MPLPSFSVTGNLNDIPGANVAGELVTTALSAATLRFTDNTRAPHIVLWDGELYRLPRPVTVYVSDDGSVSDEDNPVLLLANDDGLNVTGLQWTVEIVISGSAVASWTFDAPDDGGTVDLATVAHAPGVTATGAAGVTEAQLLALIEDGDSDVHDAIVALGAGFFDLPATTHAATGKTTPVNADELALVDSAASNGLKKLTWANLKAAILTAVGASGSAATLTTSRNIDGQAFNGSANITVIAPGTHAATGKTTPVNADEIPLVDSAASNVLKKLTWTNLKKQVASAINVKDYGALGNDSTNDTAAIAAALAVAQASSRPLYFPAGTYLTDDIADGSNIAWIGDGQVETVIKARAGSTTLVSTTDGTFGTAAAKPMSGFMLDGDGISDTCLDSSWPTDGPSVRHVLRNIYIRNYLSIGWIGDNNNDCDLSHITVEKFSDTPDEALAASFHASGGAITLNNCVFLRPIRISCQVATIRDGYNFGIVFDDAGTNSLSIHNGYLYANPTTHNNFDIETGITVRGLSILGTHVENSHNDGFIFGGAGQLDGVTAIGGEWLGISGTTPAPKIAENTLCASGIWGVVSLDGIFAENLTIADATKVRVFTRNIEYEGAYQSRAGYVNADGGIMLSVGSTGLGYKRDSVVTKPLYHGEIDVSAAGTTVTSLPRTGILVAKDSGAGDGCTLVAAYSRIGSSAGTVTSIHSAASAGAVTLALTIGSGLTQDQFTTSATLTLSGGSNQIIAYTVIGF